MLGVSTHLMMTRLLMLVLDRDLIPLCWPPGSTVEVSDLQKISDDDKKIGRRSWNHSQSQDENDKDNGEKDERCGLNGKTDQDELQESSRRLSSPSSLVFRFANRLNHCSDSPHHQFSSYYPQQPVIHLQQPGTKTSQYRSSKRSLRVSHER